MEFIGKMWKGITDTVGKVKDVMNGGIGKLTNRFVPFLKKLPQIGSYVRSMEPSDVKYAQMCQESYKPPNQRNNVAGYTHSEDTDERCIYSNNTERVLVIRGTETRDNYNDIGTDISIMLGREEETARFNNDLEFARTANIDKLTGHSLGATIASYISSQLNKPCIIFAPGSGKTQLQNLFRSTKPSLIRAYKVEGDPVSYLWNTGDVRLIPQKGDNPHTISNFT